MWSDVPDIDMILVQDTFYMVSTSMHMMPGCPIMKSKDLAHWEIANYVFDILEDNDAHNLIDGKNIYGQGSWAASLKQHHDKFYVCFSSNDTGKFYIYSTSDIENGNWECSVINGIYHDPALLFDEDGSAYVIYGNGDIHITQLTEDMSAVKDGGINGLLLETERNDIGLRCEGCHAYKIDGTYYLFFIEWPTSGNQRRREVCYRSSKLLGPYESKIILDHHMGYRNNGVAQGGIIQDQHGIWYAFLFQDREAVGRVPVMLPMQWEHGWPILGINGEVPEQFSVNLPAFKAKPIVESDSFEYKENKLPLNWQWNHNPDNRLWSVTARESHLRLMTGQITDTVLQARNTLTQRTEGPACQAIIKLDCSEMRVGDYAGLIALQSTFGTVGVTRVEDGQAYVKMTVNDGTGKESIIATQPVHSRIIYLKVVFNFLNSIDQANFYYSEDAIHWHSIGEKLQMKYTLDHFMGYRIGLFNYASIQAGGYVDIDYFEYKKIVE